MQYPLCRHIKTNGIQCKSPALTAGLYCFFHKRLYARHSPFRNPPATHGVLIPGHHIQLEPLEDSESVQIALSVVINALATGQLETKRATALLYGLQLASMNAANLDLQPYAPEVVRSAEALPDGLDLAEPGALVDVTEYEVLLSRADIAEAEEEEAEWAEDEEYEASLAAEPTPTPSSYAPPLPRTQLSVPSGCFTKPAMQPAPDPIAQIIREISHGPSQRTDISSNPGPTNEDRPK